MPLARPLSRGKQRYKNYAFSLSLSLLLSRRIPFIAHLFYSQRDAASAAQASSGRWGDNQAYFELMLERRSLRNFAACVWEYVPNKVYLLASRTHKPRCLAHLNCNKETVLYCAE